MPRGPVLDGPVALGFTRAADTVPTATTMPGGSRYEPNETATAVGGEPVMVTLWGHISFGPGALSACPRRGGLYLLLGYPSRGPRTLAYLDPAAADAIRGGSHGPVPLRFQHNPPPLPGPIVIAAADRILGHVWGLRTSKPTD